MICVVNIDPFQAREGLCVIPVSLGWPPAFPMTDLLSGERFRWTLGRNYVRLEPGKSHVLKIEVA